MVPGLHQRNIYMKRKLRVWRDQKYISLVGAKTPLTSAGRQTTPSQLRLYRVDKENLRKFGRIYRHGSVFAPKEDLYQKSYMSGETGNVFPYSVEKPHSPVRVVKIPRLK